MVTKTTPFDSAAYLESEESVHAYMEDALESNDPAVIAHALGVVARARGMAQIAQQAGLSRESLYKALSAEGNPEFGTVLRVMHALGLKLSVSASEHHYTESVALTLLSARVRCKRVRWPGGPVLNLFFASVTGQ